MAFTVRQYARSPGGRKPTSVRPADHYAIVRARPRHAADAPDGIGTIVVSRDPLSAADLGQIDHQSMTSLLDARLIAGGESVLERFNRLLMRQIWPAATRC